MDKIKLATVWLAGCSGCHMSFLDLDEWLFDLAAQVEVVFSPIADVKTYPDHVDLCLVEGAVANTENLALALQIRQRTQTVVSFGDCAVTGNVPAMRNLLDGSGTVLQRGYLELSDCQPQLPSAPGIVPDLLEQVLPLHRVIPVDYFLPGCPPDAPRIQAFVSALLRGETPVMEGEAMIQFG